MGNPRKNIPEGLPFKFSDYLALVDWTGKQTRNDKREKIDANPPPLLNRLNFEAENWLHLSMYFESKLKDLVGSVISLKVACEKMGYKRTVFKYCCEQYFP